MSFAAIWDPTYVPRDHVAAVALAPSGHRVNGEPLLYLLILLHPTALDADGGAIQLLEGNAAMLDPLAARMAAILGLEGVRSLPAVPGANSNPNR